MISDQNTIKPGLAFKDDNGTSFRTIDKVDGRPGFWYVHQFVISRGFRRTKPTIIEMSEEKILEFYTRDLGDRALGNMRNSTTGERAGLRARMRDPRPRKRFYFIHSGGVAATTSPC